MRQYDIIVAGGGFTGVAAGIAAAREGHRVLIVEQYGFLGGAACSSYVNPFMIHAIPDGEGGWIQLNAGIFQEILNRLKELGGLDRDNRSFNDEILKLVLDRMVTEHGVQVLFHTYITGVNTQGDRIQSITVANKSGVTELSADYFIDCTGDADVAAGAGCPFHIGREGDNACQPMTMCFRVINVDTGRFWSNWASANAKYQELQREGKIKNTREDLLLFHHIARGVVHFNSTRILNKSGVDAWDLSAAEMEVRGQVFGLYSMMKEYAEGFENSVLFSAAPQIGVRESRMIDGEYTLTAEDLLACKPFEDSIAVGAYGIDIHSPDGSGTDRREIGGRYYYIPYRSLIPKGVKNLLVAGRCISSTHEAQSAYRVLPIVCCIGEGAGTAAALACRDGADVRDVCVEELHRLLDQHGAKYC